MCSVDVVADYGRADDAIGPIERLQPNLVLMDIDMPGLEAFRAARTIMDRSPGTRIVFLSAFSNDRYIEEVLAMGDWGYLTKEERPAEIVAALLQVVEGGVCYSTQIRERIVIDEGGVHLGESSKTRASMLTSRELEILRYVAQGMSHREIADAAGVRPKTVEAAATSSSVHQTKWTKELF